MSDVPLKISLSDEKDGSDGNERPIIDETSSLLYEKLNPVLQLFSGFAEAPIDSAIFLERLLDQIKIVMGADLLLLFGWDEGKQEWPLLYHHRLPKHIVKDGSVPRAWQSLPTIVLHEGGSLSSDNISKDRRFIGQVIRGMNLRTFSGTTLRSKEKVYGSLSVSYLNPNALSPSDQTAFMVLAKFLIPFLPRQRKAHEARTEPVWLSLDMAGRILSCNLRFTNLLGYKKEQIQNARFSDFLTKAGKGAYSESIKTLKKDKEKISPFKLELAKQGGQKRVLMTSLNFKKNEDALPTIELSAEDITDVEPLEKELVNKDALFSILNSIFTSLEHFTEEEDELKLALEKAFPLFGVDGGTLYRLDERKRKLCLIADQGLLSETAKQIEKSGIDIGEHVLWKVVEKKTPVLLIAEGKEASLDKRLVGNDQLLSYMGVPVESADRLWGVLSLFSRSRVFSKIDLKFFEKFGKEVGFVIDKIQLVRQLRKRMASLKILNEAGKSLSKSLHLEQILSSAANNLKNLIGASNGYIFLGDDRRHLFTGVAASDQLGDAIRKFEIKMNEKGFVPLTARERHPFVIENASRDARVSKIWMKVFKSRSLLSVPLISKERVTGVVVLDETRYFRKFTDEEVEKIVGMSDQISVAIENATLYNSVSRHRERLQTLSSAFVNIQEEEHRRIAKKLRKDAGEALSTIQQDLTWMRETMEHPTAEIEDRIAKMNTQLGETLEILRVLSHELRPAILDESGLIPTLKWYIKEFESQHKTKVHLQTAGLSKRLPARIETLFFRIMQEAVSNIADHSNAESAIISLEKREPYVHLYITDDGLGFDVKRYFSSPQIIRKGIGILGMKERIELAGGTFYIDSNPGKGTRISIRVPVVRRSSS